MSELLGVPVESRRSGVAQADRGFNEVETHILEGMGLDPRVVAPNVKDFYQRIGGMESDNNEQASNSVSSAKGVYQFLNGNKKDPEGNKASSSFQVGLNRVKRAYKKAGTTTPEWVKKAEKHEDPRQLTREQSDTLLLADLVYGAKPVSANMKEYFIYGQGNPKALHDVYKEHHTDVTNSAEQGDVLTRMDKHLGSKTP